MVPAGYMYKRVVAAPDWLEGLDADIYSVSGCMSEAFADYIRHWRHNGYWLFDSAEIMEALAGEQGIDLTGLTLFYYEVFGEQYDQVSRHWTTFGPESGCSTNVAAPEAKHLEGYDVVTFAAQSSPECSPLSCNALATRAAVNRHCLFASFDEARASLEQGFFDECEPGPFRIFAVYTLA